jgi:hypothetical protein
MPIKDFVTIDLPKGSLILTVQPQGDKLVLWAVVDCGKEVIKVNYHFRIRGTGHPIGDMEDLTYVSTSQIDGLVWHVFYVNEGDSNG